MEAAHGFAEEIDFKDLFFEEIVDRGAFGVVRRAYLKGKVVAVKLIETETEKKAFFTELKQLSRVNHRNIVGLYGACTTPPVCLVMEYAEGGSLYNVLHGARFVDQLDYTTAHGMSWALQTARGVEYLHSMKPKPLIHRDLKPPNLLLVQGGTVLKICDFGTACDAHTHMTNNKGSAAWMAPEVFEGSNYSEKCDVFSFGIILWEILTRRKPFDEIGGPAFRIMWAVHNGTRPPLIKNCPKPVEVLMCKCWSANPVERPSMAEICRVMSVLFQLFKGADEPLQYPSAQETEYTPPGTMGTPRPHGTYANPPTGGSQISSVGTPTHETVKRAISEMGEPVQVFQPPQRTATPPVVVEEENPRRTSAPASLAASRESLLDGKGSRSSTPNIDLSNKRYSADLSKLDEAAGIQGTPAPQPGFVRGHRRACSHGTPFVVPSNQLSPHWAPSQPVKGHRRSGSHGNAPTFSAADIAAYTGVPHVTSTDVLTSFHHSITAPGNLGSLCAEPNPSAWTPGHPVNITSHLFSSGSENAALTMAIAAMDHQLQPLAPCATCPESVTIFQQHIQYAQEYLRVQAEIALLNQRKHELQRELQAEEKEKENSNKMAEEYKQIISENESLMLLQHNLTKQVEPIRKQRQRAV